MFGSCYKKVSVSFTIISSIDSNLNFKIQVFALHLVNDYDIYINYEKSQDIPVCAI